MGPSRAIFIEGTPGEAYLQMSEQNIIPALGNIFYDT